LWALMFFFVWVRGTLVRFRYDQFMRFGWKVLIPVGLGWVVAVAVVQGVRQFTDVELRTLLWILAGVAAVATVAMFVIPEQPKAEPEPAKDEGPFDPFAGGYPVPPLPGQTLPPSPRRRRAPTSPADDAPAGAIEQGPVTTAEEEPRGCHGHHPAHARGGRGARAARLHPAHTAEAGPRPGARPRRGLRRHG